MDLDLPNPFVDKNAANHHPALRAEKSAIPQGGAVNGLIKFNLRSLEKSDDQGRGTAPKIQQLAAPFKSVAVHHKPEHSKIASVVPALPPDFGRVSGLDATDEKLWKFCE